MKRISVINRNIYIFLLAMTSSLGFLLNGQSIITNVYVGNNQEQQPLERLDLSDVHSPPTLSYDQNYLIFNLNPIIDSAQRKFSYRLEGLDYDWLPCINCNQIQYAHLDGGEYKLIIKNDSDDIIETFEFNIQGNMLHQWWFVPLIILFLLSITGVFIYLLALYRLRQQLKSQLAIHKEKMSSMADLTSGVAHELQNPLNFVSNFSELSSELLEEMEEELEKEDLDEVKIILSDLKENLNRINNHGGRASGIVKNMLAHSKIGSGEKDQTNINALCDQMIRVAFKAFSTEKNFNLIDIETAYDSSIPELKIVKKDIGRVIQNIIDNACYSTMQKALTTTKEHHSKIKISTLMVNGNVVLTIEDNGMGMSKEVLGKVFQPFYTTKPTGEGTGLGMSLSYDIVTKEHNGSLIADSQEGSGALFKITLPINKNL